MTEALEHMRSGAGPTVIEADVYRYFHQNGGFAGSAFRYRSKEEEASWRARDPIEQLSSQLLRREILAADEIELATSRAQELIAPGSDQRPVR
jgi:2-oxoisovalerate dehydrogenase E1 component